MSNKKRPKANKLKNRIHKKNNKEKKYLKT